MTTAIERTAQQWINEALQEQEPKPGLPPATLLLSPASWVLPKLLRIISQNTSQPVEVLAPLIRTMLLEQAFATTGGDPCDSERIEKSVDQTVSILVRVLERVRQQCPGSIDLGA